MADELALKMTDEQIQKTIQNSSKDQLRRLLWDRSFWLRPKQQAPEGDWRTWLVLAGRGFGKTRTGAEWVHQRAMAQPRWIALVAKTPADARDFCIEGPGGLLKNTPPWERPTYWPSKRRITWANGSWATIYSDEAPDQLRGYSGDTAWLDEFGKFRYPQEVWDNLQFGMREASADRPRQLITTTPRPLKILQKIKDMKTTMFVTGSSHENRANLDPTWYRETILDYDNTRLGRQEIYAEILEDFPGALWSRALLEKNRFAGRDPREQTKDQWREWWKLRLKRVVVAMDPAGTSEEGAAEHGIIVAGINAQDEGLVLEDLSRLATPAQAAAVMIKAYDDWSADCCIGEVNNGGDWIGTTIQSVAKIQKLEGQRTGGTIAYRAVRATRGKWTRAEPISTLDEKGQIHHVGMFPELEDQMCTWDPNAGMKSPDRMDARVWAFTDLMVGSKKGRAGVLF